MNILVTGGAGFIGSATAKQLHAEGNNVVVIDNFNTYYDLQLKKDRVKNLILDVELVDMDITNKAGLQELFQKYSFDVVCHFAAQAGVRYSVEAPEVYVTTNVLGTQTLLEVMKDNGVKRMVNASTSSAYGVDTTVPFKEDSSADRPVSVYAATKRAAELLTYNYFHQYGIQVTNLRFFTVYGPWSRPDMAMLKFTHNIMADKPIDIYNHGDLQRDFTYIDDIVAGFVAAVDKPLGYEIVNIGNGKPVKLLDFVALLEKHLGKQAQQNLLPMQQGDVYETYADTTKAEKLLNFQPATSFEEGVGSFVEWYRSYY